MPSVAPEPVKVPIPERGLMLGRGLANVGAALGAADALEALADDAATTAAPPDAMTSTAALPSQGTGASQEPGATAGGGTGSTTGTPTADSAAEIAPSAVTGSPLLIAVAVLAALGAAILGYLGWRSR